MAKIAFSKLNKIKSIPTKTITIADTEISIMQYLPLEEKLNLIQTIINLSGNGEEGFYNIVKLQTYYTIEMIKAYTNISITDKQQDDIPKLYDSIVINHIWEEVGKVIPQEEQEYIWDNLLNLAREITDYNHSALGILKSITADYKNLDLNTEKLQKELSNPETISLVKDIVTKLG